MERLGLVRVGAGVPRVHVANPHANVTEILKLVKQSAAESCDLLVLPELAITGYTCADLFQQHQLQRAAVEQLQRLAEQSSIYFEGVIAVGVPVVHKGGLYSTAAVLQAGRILGLVPKTYIPNYGEFYERRWFVAGRRGMEPLNLAGDEIPFGTDLLFSDPAFLNLTVGIEICEDLWAPVPPSTNQSLAGATLLLNLSASNESTGKADYRRQLVSSQSGRCIAGYAYAGAGVTESTTDLVFGGHALIAESGGFLAESERFRRESSLLVADVDVDRLVHDRMHLATYTEQQAALRHEYRKIEITARERPDVPLRRHVAAHPFVPASTRMLESRCHEIFATQTAGLAKRLEIARPPSLQIGVSGGLDSTLALLVAVKTCDLLDWPRDSIHALTMPGFGTSQRTQQNADKIMELLGVRAETIDIRPLCMDTFVTLGHQPFGIDPKEMSVKEFVSALSQVDGQGDLVFENVQARVRTLLLMNRGFVIGTGDLSEMALGWSTYNADHMSMYNPNCTIPKTLVRFLVRWAADHEFDGELREVLHSIADTEISPELLPIKQNSEIQSTESTIGPYELHDFFLYHMFRFGYPPRKILYFAAMAKFNDEYSLAQIRRHLKTFYRRFFQNQFKRSCIPDGPKVGTVTLSPRGDWRMPSDADVTAWLADLEENPAQSQAEPV